MSDALLRVSFDCNDEHGNFQGECYGLEVNDDGDTVISFSTLDVPMRWEVASVVLDKEEFATASVRGRWVGNLFWDEVHMKHEEVERLVRWLIANAGKPIEWQSEHPIGRLADTEVYAA